MRVYRNSNRDGQGRVRARAKWYVEFRDHNQVLRRLAAFKDKGASAELGRKLEQLAAYRIAHEAPDPTLARWLQGLPSVITRKLADVGLLDARRVLAGRSLAFHLLGWWHHLRAKNNTTMHSRTQLARVIRILRDCDMRHFSDLSASKVQEYLAGLRGEPERMAVQTSNYYLQAIKQFCRWMVRDGRAVHSPLSHLQALNAKADVRHERRALSVEEMQALLASTAAGPDVLGVAGDERALLYRVVAETGLRANEIRTLTRSRVHLGQGEPYLLVTAAYAKARKERRAPLKVSTAQLLAIHVAKKLPHARVFTMPSRYGTAEMIRTDLAMARAAWIDLATDPTDRRDREESNFLRYEDDAGRLADFHVLRHTRGVWLFEHHKAHPREVQELLGVSSLSLVDRYTRSFRLADGALIERGPDLTLPDAAAAGRATGTDGESPDGHRSTRREKQPSEGGGAAVEGKRGAKRGAMGRTSMPPVHSDALSELSDRGMELGGACPFFRARLIRVGQSL